MTIQQTLLRNVLRHQSPNFCCGRINVVTGGLANTNSFRVRGLHSFRIKSLPKSDLLTVNRFERSGVSAGVFGGPHLSSLFIIARNESSGSGPPLSSISSTPASTEFITETSRAIPHTQSLVSQSSQSQPRPSSPLSEESFSSSVASTPTPVSEPVQEILTFESIPEPPTLPVEDLVAAAAGEPSLASLGLAGWSPSGIIQQCLEFFHINLGMPWWLSIVTGTIIVRVLLFPLVIKSQKNAARMQNNMPQMQVLQAKMTEARQTGNALLSAKYGQELMVFMKEKDISPFKSLMVPLAMAPVFMSFFFGLRKMANLPVESLKDGGLFWFTDLTLADPFYALPLITSLTVWATLEIGADGMKLNQSTHGPLMKYVLRAMPVVMFPFTINFPAAILCYWVSTNAISLVQVSILKIPAVRAKLGIEQIRPMPTEFLQVKKKGFKESVKDSWTNVKISREIEDRQRYDEISFQRAGRGPIAKTYKYDPTKVKPQDATALQAKIK